jgi:aspartyl-tRNA(Asn)/glutamyl-tRNA(Gln) amidotransferase subunit C
VGEDNTTYICFMVVTDELIMELATLARLEFSESERQAVQADLTSMIQFIEQLQVLDVDQVEPLMHMGDARNAFRQDIIQPGMDRAEALANAPAANDQFFKVPKVISRA